jgi:nicotinamide-nucleotide amidase
MQAFSESALILIGDELLEGRTRDSNLENLSKILHSHGLPVSQCRIIHDEVQVVSRTLRDTAAPHLLLVTTGGLGPTDDDLTLSSVACAASVPIERDSRAVDMIRDCYSRLGREMPDSALKQADIPKGALPVANPRGIAPGIVLNLPSFSVICVPGVPAEAEDLLPVCLEAAGCPCNPESSGIDYIRTWGIPENSLFDRFSSEASLAGVELGFLPTIGRVDIRIKGDREREFSRMICRSLGSHCYSSTQERSLEAAVGELLGKQELTLAVAESCTGGLLGASLTSVPGSSGWFSGGVISYSNTVKVNLLGVSEEVIDEHGAVSGEVVLAMVSGVALKLCCDASLAISGVAGPGGGTVDKPVGTVWIAVQVRNLSETREYHFPGGREAVRMGAVSSALGMLYSMLKKGL